MNNKVVLMDRKKLLEIFQYLNERLKENKVQLEITIYGGSVMTMVYDNRPATRDIDCILNGLNDKILNRILEMTRFAFNLTGNWINEDIKEPLKYLLKEDKETYRVYSNLKILKPKAEQMLAMKILASRVEPSKDFVDAFMLCKELNIRTKENLLETISNYIPKSLLGERQQSFIKYLAKDLGYDWE